MPKHMKVIAKLTADLRFVDITILEQTHIGDSFGPCGHVFYLENKCLYSANVPALSEALPNSRFFVRGTSRYADARVVRVNLKAWKWIKPLIEAYNEWGATQI